MDRLTETLARLFRPIMRPVSLWLLSDRRRWQTWRYEFAFVAAMLLPVALLTSDWSSVRAAIMTCVTPFAVLWSFGHAKVASRTMEAQAVTEQVTVPCYRESDKYWMKKEVAWTIVFIAGGLYSALVGTTIFMLYPVWRKVHLDARQEVRGTRFGPDHAAALKK